MSSFEQYTACDAADAMVAAGINNGAAIPYLRQQSGPRRTVAGPAYTVEYAAKDDPRPAVSGHYIDSAPPGSIILIATAANLQIPYAPFTKLNNSLYGGLMSTRARYLGAKGTVVLGSIRDIAEQKALDYPVFSYNVGVCAPNKLAKVVAVNEPLQVGENQVVNPGDIVVADENGVVAIPQDKVNNALDYIPKRTNADTLAAEDIKSGIPAAKAQKHRRQNL